MQTGALSTTQGWLLHLAEDKILILDSTPNLINIISIQILREMWLKKLLFLEPHISPMERMVIKESKMESCYGI